MIPTFSLPLIINWYYDSNGSFNLELQLKDAQSAIKNKFEKLWTELRGFKFITILVLLLKSANNYSHSKAWTVIGESDIDNVFESTCTTIIWNIQKSFGKGSGWIIDSVIDIILVFQSIIL